MTILLSVKRLAVIAQRGFASDESTRLAIVMIVVLLGMITTELIQNLF
jgi:hypothetical protein